MITEEEEMFINCDYQIRSTLRHIADKNSEPSELYEPRNVASLAVIKEVDNPAYQEIRIELKKLINITELEKLMNENIQSSGSKAEKLSVVDEILAKLETECVFFHDSSRTAYVTIQREGHAETYQVRSKVFSSFIQSYVYSNSRKNLSETSLKNIINTLEGRSRFEGEKIDVFLRVGNYKDGYIIDLGNDKWQVVFVNHKGWKTLDKSPIKFWRTDSMQALPKPKEKVKSNDIAKLWKFINVKHEDRVFVLAFILECWRNNTVFPILELIGTQGSAKSSTQEMIRMLVDPNKVPLRAAPNNIEALFVSANQNWVASLNNLSHLNRDYQDALCILSTGGGWSSRKLYSNAEESVIEVTRPCMLNGIGAVVTAPDLLDRTISLELPKISEYKSELELKREFNEMKTDIFSALINLFRLALGRLPDVESMQINDRMADFVMLGEALQLVAGEKKTFSQLWQDKKAQATTNAIESSPAIMSIMALVEKSPFEGTYSRLLKSLKYNSNNPYGLPKSAKGLADLLKRHAPAMHHLGVNVLPHKVRKTEGYWVTISRDSYEQSDELGIIDEFGIF